MKTKNIRSENDKFYYCGDYLWSIRRRYILYSVGFVIAIEVILGWIRRLILKRQFIKEAAVQNLKYEDVMDWVNAKVAEQRIDAGIFIILGFSIVIGIFMFLHVSGVIKSYHLYKKWWLRGALVILCALECLAILVNYDLKIRNNISIYIMLIVDIAPIIVSSKMLYPLESRPRTKEEKSIIKIFDLVTQLIMKRL